MTTAIDPALLAKLTPEQVQAALKRLSPDQAKALKGLTTEIAWRQGDLSYKYHQTQRLIARAIDRSERRKFFLLCSRRTGKSFMLLTRLFSHARKHPGSRLLFLAPHARNAAEIAKDLAVEILKDCPSALRPDFSSQDKEFVFRHPGGNDSIVRLKGVNNEHYQSLRGGAQDEIVIDECGQMDNLTKIVNDVCMPMTMTTGGRILLASTPPDSPGHESATIYESLVSSDSTVRFTIRDTPHVDDETKRLMLMEVGENPDYVDAILRGEREPETTTAQREYFCEFVTDASRAVVPEYTSKARSEIVRDHERPDYFQAYVSCDPGQKDRTGVLFAYWDFRNAKLVIEDELLLDHPTTRDLATAVRKKEAELWPGRTPLRFLDAAGDGGLRFMADMRQQFGVEWRAARKDDRLAAINLMRTSVQSRELVISPRCKHLDRQLRDVIWNTRASDFSRAGEGSIDGHYDLVAALVYLCRSVNRKANPFPASYFDVGGKFGLPAGTMISPRARAKRGPQVRGLGLLLDTPTGRMLAGED